MEVPSEPVLFFKASSAIIGPNDDVILPRNSKKSDLEVELAIVIGAKASYVEEENAMNHIAGYVLHNDISEREFHWKDQTMGQRKRGYFCTLRSLYSNTEEIKDPHNLTCG